MLSQFGRGLSGQNAESGELVSRGFSIGVAERIVHFRPDIISEFSEIPTHHRLGKPQLTYRGFSGVDEVNLRLPGKHREAKPVEWKGEMFFSIDPNMALGYATGRKTESLDETSYGFILEYEFPTFAMKLHEPPTLSTLFSLFDEEAVSTVAFLKRVGLVNNSDLVERKRNWVPDAHGHLYTPYSLSEVVWYEPSQIIKDGKLIVPKP